MSSNENAHACDAPCLCRLHQAIFGEPADAQVIDPVVVERIEMLAIHRALDEHGGEPAQPGARPQQRHEPGRAVRESSKPPPSRRCSMPDAVLP